MYKGGKLTRGDLRKADVLWVLNEAYKAKELSRSDISEQDVTGAGVEVEPADVPSVETITEPNAESARAQGRLDKSKEKGIDVSALQAKLDEINELRSGLIVAKGERLLASTKQRNIDVSGEEAKLNEIKALVDSADAKYKSNDLAGAKEDLKQAQEKFKDLRNDVISRRRAK